MCPHCERRQRVESTTVWLLGLPIDLNEEDAEGSGQDLAGGLNLTNANLHYLMSSTGFSRFRFEHMVTKEVT